MSEKKSLEEKILSAAKAYKTKVELSAKCGVGYSRVSRVVNALVDAGKLVAQTSKPQGLGRPATKYRKVS